MVFRRDRNCGRQVAPEGPLGIDELAGAEVAQHDGFVPSVEQPAGFGMEPGEVAALQGRRGGKSFQECREAGEFAVDDECHMPRNLQSVALEPFPFRGRIAQQQEGGERQQRNADCGDEPQQVALRR